MSNSRRLLGTAEWLAIQYVPGFSAHDRSPISTQTFRAYGHHAARAVGGKFVIDERPGVCKNHEIGLVLLPDSTTRVLLHHEIPLLAFAHYNSSDDGYGGYDFRDAPNLAVAFGAPFVAIPRNILQQSMDVAALERAVGKSNDIRYWNPRCVGDVFYNFWD